MTKKRSVAYLLKHRTVFGVLGAIIACVVALIYYFVVPEEAKRAEGAARFILLYAHSLCWVLLALASGLFAAGSKKRLMGFVAYGALAVYAVFIITLFVMKAGLYE